MRLLRRVRVVSEGIYVTSMLLEGRRGEVLNLVLDVRAAHALARLARWAGKSKSAVVRELIHEAHLRLVSGAEKNAPPGESPRREAFKFVYARTRWEAQKAGTPPQEGRSLAREAARAASRAVADGHASPPPPVPRRGAGTSPVKRKLLQLARARRASMCRVVRALILDAYEGKFGEQPSGATIDAPPSFTEERRRVYQNAYATTRRTALREGKTLSQARALARAAGQKAATPLATEQSWEELLERLTREVVGSAPDPSLRSRQRVAS